jgi:hypothetical protein
MGWDITNNGTSIIITNTDGYSKTINKDQVQVIKEAEDSYLRVASSQTPYQDLAWWTPETITDLTGATTIADGYTIISTYLATN